MQILDRFLGMCTEGLGRADESLLNVLKIVLGPRFLALQAYAQCMSVGAACTAIEPVLFVCNFFLSCMETCFESTRPEFGWSIATMLIGA